MVRVIERFEVLEDTLVGSEEILASLRGFEETGDSQVFTERMLLTVAGLKGNLVDEYNNSGRDTSCLVNDSKLRCVELLRNEFIEN